MNLHWIDWSIIGGLFVFVCSIAFTATRYTKSVADFLAANRCAKRYILSISDGIAGMGAITVIGFWQMYYENGFTGAWWGLIMLPVYMIISVTGYIIYRYRQTLALTLGQFFETRYSKKFRLFAGILCFVSGTINFGIFPAVGANFFMYFCGFPEAFTVGTITLKTFPTIMAILLITSLFFTWIGGQIAIIITDFFQGIFCNIVFLIVLVTVFWVIDWQQIGEAFAMAPAGKSLVHPFKGSGFESFSVWYYIIACIGAFYSFMSWQGSQAYNCSAKTPHEAKMAKILGGWRAMAQSLMLIIIPVIAYTIMNHPAYSDLAADINSLLGKIGNEQVQNQMTVPVVLAKFLPLGIKGALAAVMLAAFISTHDTYMHSWGSIFIQDVIMPFRKKPFGVKQHMWLLRLSILGVAVFIFCFSLFFRQVEAILMFFALTGTIFLGGSGAVIIGGLYWKRGTTFGAWGAMIIGVTIAVAGFVLQKAWPIWFDGSKFPINSQWLWGVAMATSSLVYITLSLQERKKFNLDRMLHRGKYAIQEGVTDSGKNSPANKPSLPQEHSTILQRLGLSHEFTFTDKAIFWATIGWCFLWFAIFLVGTGYNLLFEVSDEAWLKYWKFYSWTTFVLAVITTIWFTIGGLVNIKQMFHDLAVAKRNAEDDGMVIDHHSLSDHWPENDEPESSRQL